MLTAEENVLLPLAIAGAQARRGVARASCSTTVGLADRRCAPALRALRRPAAARRGRARARLASRRSLFADEPTGNLDSQTSGEILEPAPRAPSTSYGQTTVMVTHDPRAADDRRPDPLPRRRRIVRDLGQSTQAEVLAAMQEVATDDARRAQGPARPQAPRRPDGARDRPRRRDGQRHVRPHRHDLRRRSTRSSPASTTQTDAVVSGKKLVDYSSSGNATVSADAAREGPRRCRTSRRRAGTILDLSGDSTQAKLIDRDGKAIDRRRQPDLRLRRRPVAAALQPAQADRGPLGGRAATRS